MSAIRTITAAEFADDCPVSLNLLGRIIRADADDLRSLLQTIREGRRASMALWLYSRSHTRELGVQVAATCDEAALRREAGHVGSILHDLSRRPNAAPSNGSRSTIRRVASAAAITGHEHRTVRCQPMTSEARTYRNGGS